MTHPLMQWRGFQHVVVFGCIGFLDLATSLVQAIETFQGGIVTVFIHSNGTVSSF